MNQTERIVFKILKQKNCFIGIFRQVSKNLLPSRSLVLTHFLYAKKLTQIINKPNLVDFSGLPRLNVSTAVSLVKDDF